MDRRRRPHPFDAFVVSLAAACAFFTLYLARGFDDNRLTSWQWVFADADPGRLAALLMGGLLLAWLGTSLSLPERARPAALFVVSFAAGSAFWREPEVIVDAARYFGQAKLLAAHGVGHFLDAWGRTIPAWTDLPLVPFLYGLVFTVLGEHRVAIQVSTTLAFAGTVVLTYALGRTLWNETVGLLAGGLLLGMPYLVTQVPLMLVDVPAMFLVTLAAVTATRAIRDGGALRMSGATVALLAALLAKFSTWPVLAAVLAASLVSFRTSGRRGATGRLLLVLVPALGVIGLLAAARLDVAVAQLRLLHDYQLPGLGRWRESFASTFLFQIHPFLTVAAAASLVLAVRARDLRYLVAVAPVAVALGLGLERARYLVIVLPMVALMAAHGLTAIADAAVRRFVAAAIVTGSLVVALGGYLPHLQAMSAINLQDAGAYLDRIGAGAVEVAALPQAAAINPSVSVPLLDLFTGATVVHRAGPAGRPPGIERSALRFTWEGLAPEVVMTSDPPPDDAPFVVILARADQPLPEPVAARIAGWRLTRAFEFSDPWFEYQTVVHVYEPQPRPAVAGRS